jgi:methionyl aminopeptidase
MIFIKTEKEIEIMKEGGKKLANIMKKLAKMVRPGVNTEELNRAAKALIFKSKGIPSFLGYDGFPAVICTSLNNEIVHAIPSKKRVLKEGDILSLDIGMEYKGFHTDMAITLPVGKVSSEVEKLLKVTRKSLELAIEKAKPGNTFGDIGDAIQEYVESQGFGVIRDLCSHGIGRDLHEDPQILNYGKKGTGPRILKGMTFCIEPMVSMGSWKIRKSEDGQTYVTADGSLSCHFEHTLAMTEKGCLVLTKMK